MARITGIRSINKKAASPLPLGGSSPPSATTSWSEHPQNGKGDTPLQTPILYGRKRYFLPYKKSGNNRIAYVFLAPSILFFTLFIIWPLAQTFYLSFTSWNGINEITFVGLKNYTYFFQDQIAFKSVTNNLIWVVVICTIPVIIGLVQASILVNSGIRGSNIFQLILFLPQVFSSVVVTVIWNWIYNPVLGPLNTMLRSIGLEKLALPWLGNPNTVIIALLVMDVWVLYGFNTVVYSAAIQAVDTQLYEAATIDGCGMFRKFFNITIPCVSRTTTTLLLFALIDSFMIFDIVFQMTRGGPGYSSYVLSYYLYNQAFMNSRIGYGATIAVVFTVFLLLLSRCLLIIRERGEKK
jgi:ABC-type sugar transport system permease subunit